jgi:hypothetical protein
LLKSNAMSFAAEAFELYEVLAEAAKTLPPSPRQIRRAL